MRRTSRSPISEFELAGERSGGGDELDPVEVERTEDVEQERAGLAHVGGGPQELAEHRSGHLVHLCRRGGRGDDLGPCDERVAVAMVTVGMGVDHGGDALGSRGLPAQRREHLGGQLEVEQGVDQH